MFPKVKWASNEYLESQANHLKKLKRSWIKGMCAYEENNIYLNVHITQTKRPVYHEAECLFHEVMHYMIRSMVFHRIWDTISRTLARNKIV